MRNALGIRSNAAANRQYQDENYDPASFHVKMG